MSFVEDSQESSAPKVSLRIYLLPNLLTTANLFFGFFAIILSIQGTPVKAAYAIVAAAVFDLLDGRLARLTHATSRFGAEYDSLSDLVSFCLAPALLLYLWALDPFGRIGWLASFLFVTCGALRLARFNVQAQVVEKSFFQGLPTPMAAGIVASGVLAFDELGWEARGHRGLLVMTFLVALVMVSNFRYRSFKDLDLRDRLSFKWLVLAVCVLIWVVLRPEVHLFILFLSYAILGALFGVFRWRRRKKNPRPIENSELAGDLFHDDDK